LRGFFAKMCKTAKNYINFVEKTIVHSAAATEQRKRERTPFNHFDTENAMKSIRIAIALHMAA